MKTLNRLFLALFTVGMVACSFGGNSSNENKAEQEDRERFMQEYAVVFGVYEGTLSSRNPQEIQLSIYPVEVQDGENGRNQPRMKMVAKAQFRWLNTNQEDIFMDVRYTAENNQLKMTKEPGNGANETFIVDGKLISEVITGSVTRNRGKLGDLNLRLKSRQSEAPSEGEELERLARLRRLYQPYAGYYEGTVIFPGRNGERRPIDLTVYVADKVNPDTGALTVNLEGEYHWGEDKPRDLTLIMAMDLHPEVNPPTIVMTSYPYKVPGTSYRISMSGTAVPGEMRVKYTDHHNAKTGDVVLRRKSNPRH